MKAVLVVLMGLSQSAFAKTDFVLTDVEPLPAAQYKMNGPGGSVFPVATLEVTYWVQPCAKQRFDQFVTTRSTYPDAVRGWVQAVMNVGVLISDTGIKCKGPHTQEKKTLTFGGAFNLPGRKPLIRRLGKL